MTEEEQRQFYINRLMDARSIARANLFMESALRKDINDMTPKELESLKYYRDYLVHNPNSFPPTPASPLRPDWDERQSIIGATNDMNRQSFRLKNELDDVPTDDMVMARELQMDPIKRKYQSMDMGIPEEDIFELAPIDPMGSPETDVPALPPSLKREMDPVLDSDVFQIQRPLTEQIPQIADTQNPIQDFAMSPQRPEFNPMTGKVETTPVPLNPSMSVMPMASTPSPTPMADETKGWFDSLKSNFSSNTDAYSDPFLLGGMAIGARDQSPVFPNTSFKGSGSGIAKGALTGAGLGAKTGTPQGALIGAGIGAVAGLLGNFDSQSVEYTPAPQIIRGSGIPFPQASSMDYYKGLI